MRKIIGLAVIGLLGYVAGGYTQKNGNAYDKLEAFGKDVAKKGKKAWDKLTKKTKEVVEEVKEEVKEAAEEVVEETKTEE
jgi:gas vesicle protein